MNINTRNIQYNNLPQQKNTTKPNFKAIPDSMVLKKLQPVHKELTQLAEKDNLTLETINAIAEKYCPKLSVTNDEIALTSSGCNAYISPFMKETLPNNSMAIDLYEKFELNTLLIDDPKQTKSFLNTLTHELAHYFQFSQDEAYGRMSSKIYDIQSPMNFYNTLSESLFKIESNLYKTKKKVDKIFNEFIKPIIEQHPEHKDNIFTFIKEETNNEHQAYNLADKLCKTKLYTNRTKRLKAFINFLDNPQKENSSLFSRLFN